MYREELNAARHARHFPEAERSSIRIIIHHCRHSNTITETGKEGNKYLITKKSEEKLQDSN